MGKVKGPHHKGDYHERSARVRAAAYGNPSTVCWRCGLTLDQARAAYHPRVFWTAGHLVDGEAGGDLLPECSRCNFRHGQRLSGRPRHSSEDW